MKNQVTRTLSNGVKMPVLGFGTCRIDTGVEEVVEAALKAGYRHLDCAAIYRNEDGVGRAIAKSNVPRDELFITSKLWNTEQGYEKTLAAFEKTITDLGVDYLDLYLIHWPKLLTNETWKAMEKLYKDGKIRAIGVSNFNIHHIEDLMKVAEIKPMVNQVEYHPRLSQPELHEFCDTHDIALEAWAPLMQGQVLEIEAIKQLAVKYNRTVAQIVLRWEIQKGVITIPKSVTPKRMVENAAIFDFELSEEDMQIMNDLNQNFRMGPDPDNNNE